MLFSLDSNTTNIVFNDTTHRDDASLMYHADNMEDGDHQLQGFAEISTAVMVIDYFECAAPCSTLSQELYANSLAASRIENSSGDPFNLLSTGPVAQNVPSEAVTVDNSSPEIIYHTAKSGWVHELNSISSYNKSLSYAPFTGSSLSYSFDGVAIWYDYQSHTIQSPTCSVGTIVMLALDTVSLRCRLMVRHHSD